MEFGLESLGLTTLLLIVLAGFAAGWVDAVVGGGGLIQLPALMVVTSGQPVTAALATNKLASIAGTSSAAYAYLRRTEPDLDVTGPAGLIAVLSAAGGAACASLRAETSPSSSSFWLRATRMPRPPPPALALMMMG